MQMMSPRIKSQVVRLMDYFDHEDEGVPEQCIDDEAMFLEQAGDEMLAIAHGCIH